MLVQDTNAREKFLLKRNKTKNTNKPESTKKLYPFYLIFYSCCSCVTWEPCVQVCGVVELLEREGLVTPSPGSAPGHPVPTAPSLYPSSLATCPTSALGSLSPAYTFVTWRTAVREKA